MKTSSFIFVFVLCLFGSVTVMAQNPVATLESNGTTKVFYGISALIDSYNASANGDQIYLSTGFFNPPPSIAKGIKITGAGHFPDSANVARRTVILSGLNIDKGADSLRLEGLFVFGDINLSGASSINCVNIIRCKFSDVYLITNVSSLVKNKCIFKECFFNTMRSSLSNSNNEITHCLISGTIIEFRNSIIDGNIFLINSLSLIHI